MNLKATLIIIMGLSTPTAFAAEGSFSGVSFAFMSSHPDFAVPPTPLSFGNVAGLDLSGHPVYSGAGHEIHFLWTQFVGRTGVMPLAPNLYGTADEACQPVTEHAGESGPADSGSITSPATFVQWFRPTLGVNQSWPITLHDQDPTPGQWAMINPNFRPARVRGDLYTIALAADFTYNACTSQEFELSCRGEAWVFIGPTLVIDLGGTDHPGAWQSIDLDRLGLDDGETYRLRIFLAHRTNGTPSGLTIRAEAMTFAPVPQVTIGGSYD